MGLAIMCFSLHQSFMCHFKRNLFHWSVVAVMTSYDKHFVWTKESLSIIFLCYFNVDDENLIKMFSNGILPNCLFNILDTYYDLLCMLLNIWNMWYTMNDVPSTRFAKVCMWLWSVALSVFIYIRDESLWNFRTKNVNQYFEIC